MRNMSEMKLSMGDLFHQSFDVKDPEQDLLLAAEIGQVLLERNKELELLLKHSQESYEEQTTQVDYYIEQVEILRQEIDSCNRSCEQLEVINQKLSNKYEQQVEECKMLNGKNERQWESIRSLENRNEELRVKVATLADELQNLPVPDVVEIAPIPIRKEKVVLNQKSEDSSLLSQSEQLTRNVSDLKVQVNLEKLQREELESHMDDVVHANQMLKAKIEALSNEVQEWERFAQKEENYRRLADAFSVKHNIEHDADLTQFSPKTRKAIAKAKSCEFLHKARISEEVNITNNFLSTVNNSSFLSELDSEYACLVKRYEALLEKCTKEGKFLENPRRTRKVQRAIQTLSFDFTTLVLPTAAKKSNLLKGTRSDSVSKTTPEEEKTKTCDYKTLFMEIFEKIQKSKDYLQQKQH